MRLKQDDREGGEAMTEIVAREDAKSDQKKMRRVKHGDKVRERKWEGRDGGEGWCATGWMCEEKLTETEDKERKWDGRRWKEDRQRLS